MPQLTRRSFLPALASPLLGAPLLAAPAARQPNIVVILADDQGWGDLSVHGNSNLSTPHIDSLARDGAIFDNFYVCSVCAPTRAEFLTGRYHPRCGVRGVSTGLERLNLDERTIANAFLDSGYRTAAFGKWHSGSQFPYHPNARGFQEYYGFTSGHWGQYFDTELDHNGRLTRGRGFIIDDLTDHALQFIEQNRRNPFFCYLPLNTPHSPMQVPDRWYRKFADYQPKMLATNPQQEDLLMTRAALAMVENIDYNVGRVLSQLERLQLSRDTVVVYFSDNGPNSWRWNGGMKGRKGSLDEGGLRAPLLLRYPAQVPTGLRLPQIAGAIDLFPTLAAFAGVNSNAGKPLDGRPLQPLLRTSPGPWPERLIFSMQNRRSSVRSQRFRLDPAGALFDIESDRGQTRNAAAEFPQEAARLQSALDQWNGEMLPLVGKDDRPYTAGFSEYTLLPARDGVPHGAVKRSSIHPNCSYFTNWRSTADSITWDVEIGRAGLYEAAIHYTCPAADTGATIELSFGEARTQAVVDKAYDPPILGPSQDRAPRTESVVKDFIPFALGRIQLARTRGQLTLRATDIPHAQAAEVRYLTLRFIRPA
ncbi:MAG: arylsulfatase [Acidobacteria bacterium]|nr:arylsulfatase [Acidobacteriota bacterium]